MNITYDPEVDALSIRFQSGTASTEFDESKGVALGYDAEGRLRQLRCWTPAGTSEIWTPSDS